MEAGYDYLHGRLQRRIVSLTGIILLVFGILLLASGGTYYGYSASAKSNLDNLAAVFEPRSVPAITGSSASNVSLFPGKAISSEWWDNPSGYEPAYF